MGLLGIGAGATSPGFAALSPRAARARLRRGTESPDRGPLRSWTLHGTRRRRRVAPAIQRQCDRDARQHRNPGGPEGDE